MRPGELRYLSRESRYRCLAVGGDVAVTHVYSNIKLVKPGNEFVIMRTDVLLSRHVEEASPGRRWCPVSQSPSDGPERVPPWHAFSGDDAPAPGPKLTELLGEAVAALGELNERQLLGVGSAARRLRAYADFVAVMG